MAELKDPFVQVLDLGDFSVTYRVAGLLEDTKRLLTFRSRLRVAMLDCLHKELKGLDETIKEITTRLKSAADDEASQPIAAELARAEQQIENIKAEIEETEQREKAKDE